MAERKLIEVATPSGQTVAIAVVDLDQSVPAAGDEKVAFGIPNLSDALDSVKDFAAGLRDKLEAAKPTTTTVEFTVGFAMKAGTLTAMFVDGQADGSVTVTLEWGGQ